MSESHNTTRGRCNPVLHDPDRVVNAGCRRPRGGDKTIQAPLFILIVNNPGEAGNFFDFFEDELGAVIVDGGNDTLQLNY